MDSTSVLLIRNIRNMFIIENGTIIMFLMDSTSVLLIRNTINMFITEIKIVFFNRNMIIHCIGFITSYRCSNHFCKSIISQMKLIICYNQSIWLEQPINLVRTTNQFLQWYRLTVARTFMKNW